MSSTRGSPSSPRCCLGIGALCQHSPGRACNPPFFVHTPVSPYISNSWLWPSTPVPFFTCKIPPLQTPPCQADSGKVIPQPNGFLGVCINPNHLPEPPRVNDPLLPLLWEMDNTILTAQGGFHLYTHFCDKTINHVNQHFSWEHQCGQHIFNSIHFSSVPVWFILLTFSQLTELPVSETEGNFFHVLPFFPNSSQHWQGFLRHFVLICKMTLQQTLFKRIPTLGCGYRPCCHLVPFNGSLLLWHLVSCSLSH